MKILVDSSLMKKQEWFESIPVFINDQEDANYDFIRKEIKKSNNNQTAYMSFELLKEKFDINDEELTIIFTIPKSISGQYNSYRTLNKNKNVLILEGSIFFISELPIKELLTKTSDPKIIEQEVNKLNMSIDMNGYILKNAFLKVKGRINSMFALLFKTANLKIRIKWKNNAWTKDKVSLNGFSLIKEQIKDKEKINILCSDSSDDFILKIKNKMLTTNPNLEIQTKDMTNCMLAHSGKDFIAIY